MPLPAVNAFIILDRFAPKDIRPVVLGEPIINLVIPTLGSEFIVNGFLQLVASPDVWSDPDHPDKTRLFRMAILLVNLDNKVVGASEVESVSFGTPEYDDWGYLMMPFQFSAILVSHGLHYVRLVWETETLAECRLSITKESIF